MNFAERLCYLRKFHNLSMGELAFKLGLKGRSSINQYEKGYSLPSIEILIAMAHMFNVTTDYLLGLSESPAQKITEYKTVPPPDYLKIKERLTFLEDEYQKFRWLLDLEEYDNEDSQKVLNHINKLHKLQKSNICDLNRLMLELRSALEGITKKYIMVDCLQEEQKGFLELIAFFKEIGNELEKISNYR